MQCACKNAWVIHFFIYFFRFKMERFQYLQVFLHITQNLILPIFPYVSGISAIFGISRYVEMLDTPLHTSFEFSIALCLNFGIRYKYQSVS